MRGTYVYRCPICKKDQTFPVEPHEAPTCRGPEKTHHKEMDFLPLKSSGTPAYMDKKKGKK